mgnify:CR=1 FL=1
MVALKNFKTYSNGEEKLIGKWKYMDTADDFKSVRIIDSEGEYLGEVRRTNEADTKGDNYFLTIGEKQVMGHKEEKGWSVYEVVEGEKKLIPIDNNSVRAKNLKNIFFEARTTLRIGGRKQRTTPRISNSRKA